MKLHSLVLGLTGLLSASSSLSTRAYAQQSPIAAAEQRDEYQQYVDNKELRLLYLTRPQKRCNIKNLRAKHQDIFEYVTKRKYKHDKPGKPYREGDDHRLNGLLDELISIDVPLAACLYQRGDEQYKEVLKDLAAHYEGQYCFGGAGRIYNHLGDRQKAEEYFKASYRTIEELIKFTPKDKLPALRDEALLQKNYFLAGKIGWYSGNREKGRKLIEQSSEFKEGSPEAIHFIQTGFYSSAAAWLWRDLKLPFYREATMVLCKTNTKCLEEARQYKASEDVFIDNYY